MISYQHRLISLLIHFTLFSPSLMVAAFAPNPPSTIVSQSMEATKKPSEADFEYQELKIQLGAMSQQNVNSNQLRPEKKTELEGYVRRVVNRRGDKSKPLYQLGDSLPGTTWNLAFTTQSLTSELPQGASVSLCFKEDGKSVDYILNFAKTLGLQKLTAASSYTVDSTPVNPGLVTYTYEKISTDVFGLSNVGVPTFGMLQGRSSHIPTVFFDDQIWIEQGVDDVTGGDYFNVYVKE